MSTHLVDQRTLWAVLAMEAGLALPLISLPSQGDRIAGPTGALLLVLLLPLGYVAVCLFASLRDPSWRILVGIGLALLTRAVVSVVPEAGPSGLAVWFGRSIVPIIIGIGLWWRGAGLSVAELTASDVRTEFGVLSICLLAILALVRPFLMSDPLLLGVSVGVFAVGGLVAAVLSRQDAAELAPVPFGRALGVATAVMPAGAAVLLVSILRPSLLGSMWWLLGRAIELIFTPIGWLVAWIASLLPQGGPPGTVQPLPRPAPDLAPDPAALAALEGRVGWIGYVVLFTLLLCGAILAILLVRVMLENVLSAPTRVPRPTSMQDVTAEAVGDPGDDASDLLGWLRAWLRNRFARRRAGATARLQEQPADVWLAYRRLLEWAAAHGVQRRTADTARELSTRVITTVPEVETVVTLVTGAYEAERYGAEPLAQERIAALRSALSSLEDR